MSASVFTLAFNIFVTKITFISSLSDIDFSVELFVL